MDAVFFEDDLLVNLSLVLSGSGFSFAILWVTLCPTFTASVPDFIRDIVLFGKLKNRKGSKPDGAKPDISRIFNVPKQYFTHFYIFGVVFNLWYMYRALQQQCTNSEQADEKVKRPTCYFNNVLAAFLIWLQIARRLYECLFISTFSRSTMHLVHYAMGFFFYFIVIQMTLFDIYNCNVQLRASMFRRAFISTPFLLLGLLCQVLQHGVLKQLAALRDVPKEAAKEPGDNSVTHFIPSGALFELVSCPHYLLEIMFYASILFIIDHGYIRWSLLLLFVTTNQIYSAIVTHHWYIVNFPNYPAQTRKAIIPFIL